MSPTDFSQARLIERIDFTDDLAMFKLKPVTPVTFQAGQYVSLAVEENSKLIQRPYSVVSSPLEPFLEFFIELVPKGQFTPRLWELKPEATLLVRNRFVGSLPLDETTGLHRHLMAATVTGAAPYISIVRTERIQLQREPRKASRFLIVHGASRSREFGIYKDELAEIAREGWLSYVPTVSRPWDDPEWKRERGRVEDVLRKHSDHLGFECSNSVAYACGHPQMIENAIGIFRRAGFPKERMKAEKFFAA